MAIATTPPPGPTSTLKPLYVVRPLPRPPSPPIAKLLRDLLVETLLAALLIAGLGIALLYAVQISTAQPPQQAIEHVMTWPYRIRSECHAANPGRSNGCLKALGLQAYGLAATDAVLASSKETIDGFSILASGRLFYFSLQACQTEDGMRKKPRNCPIYFLTAAGRRIPVFAGS